MFHAHLLCNDEELNETIKDEKRRWTQGKLGASYSYMDLIDLVCITYNNLESDTSWTVGESTKVKEDEKNYLTLAT